jgi:hypothetical protein
VAPLEGAIPSTHEGALALVGFALKAESVFNLDIPRYRLAWPGGLSGIVERCLPMLASTTT